MIFIIDVQLFPNDLVVYGMEAAVPGDGILAGPVLDERMPADLCLGVAGRGMLIEGGHQRSECFLLQVTVDIQGHTEGRLMQPFVLTLKPAGQRFPHIVDPGDVPCTEEVLFDKAHGIHNSRWDLCFQDPPCDTPRA